ncbi:hypothetical protein D3C86_2218290 [compost metagenome]
MDVEEDEVQEGEAMSGSLRKVVLDSGDAKLLKVIRQLPEESWARLKRMMSEEK